MYQKGINIYMIMVVIWLAVAEKLVKMVEYIKS